MEPKYDYTAAVQRGVALLDAKGPPGWRDRIDLDTLDIGSLTLCVLGQVYGHYYKGLRALGDDANPYHLGFATEGLLAWRALTQAWREALAQ